MLEIIQVGKTFTKNQKDLEVLFNINLRVPEGEFISLLGPSGCGKSTLLNMVAGLDKPSSGTITISGKHVTGPGTDRVVVFQEAALFPWLTVLDNVCFGLKRLGLSKTETKQKASMTLKKVHLSKFLQAYPHELSGGMRQRVAIARALVMDPQILLMDEPFGALDEQTRLMLQKELEDIYLETKKTILFVTHNIREAVLLSDRIIVLGTRPGRIIKDLRVRAARPRQHNDSNLIYLENKIMDILQVEIEKVAKEELDDDYTLTKDSFPWDPDRDLGSGI